MADEEAKISLWEAVAEFFCMLTPQQYMLLPNLIAINIFCATGENQRFLIADFFSLLGQSLATIASQPGACKSIYESKQEEKESTKERQAEGEEDENTYQQQVTQDELETSVRANPAETNRANAMSFE